MRILVALCSGSEELSRHRRRLGFDRLVVATPRGESGWVRRASGAPGGPDSVELSPRDPLRSLAEMERLLDRLRGAKEGTSRAQIRVAVDGGTFAMTAGALLACFSRGVEAWFTAGRPLRLPVLRARSVSRRVSERETAVLVALSRTETFVRLALRCGLSEPMLLSTLYELRKRGLVKTDGKSATATALGVYVRSALARERE